MREKKNISRSHLLRNPACFTNASLCAFFLFMCVFFFSTNAFSVRVDFASNGKTLRTIATICFSHANSENLQSKKKNIHGTANKYKCMLSIFLGKRLKLNKRLPFAAFDKKISATERLFMSINSTILQFNDDLHSTFVFAGFSANIK